MGEKMDKVLDESRTLHDENEALKTKIMHYLSFIETCKLLKKPPIGLFQEFLQYDCGR